MLISKILVSCTCYTQKLEKKPFNGKISYFFDRIYGSLLKINKF